MKVLGLCLLAVLASAVLTQGAVAPDWAVKKSQDDKAGAEKAAAEKEAAEAAMRGAVAGGVGGAGGADAGLCWPVVKEDSYSGAKNSFGVMEPAPGSFGSFRAGQKAKKKGEKDKPDRCHSGIDLYTGSFSKKKLSKGRVVAIDDGVVKNIYEFKQCNDGWVANSEKKTPKDTPTYAIFVYHPNLKTTINYGEASVVYVAKGEPVKKGQIISQNTACEMLHIEKYASPSEDKAVTANKQWIRPDGMKGNCAEDAKFFKENFPKQKPLEDPRPFIKSLADNANKGCPAPDDSHLEDKTHLVAGGGAKKKKEDGDKKKGGEKKKGGDKKPDADKKKKPNKKKKKFMFL